jgi:hypothetical protein
MVDNNSKTGRTPKGGYGKALATLERLMDSKDELVVMEAAKTFLAYRGVPLKDEVAPNPEQVASLVAAIEAGNKPHSLRIYVSDNITTDFLLGSHEMRISTWFHPIDSQAMLEEVAETEAAHGRVLEGVIMCRDSYNTYTSAALGKETITLSGPAPIPNQALTK